MGVNVIANCLFVWDLQMADNQARVSPASCEKLAWVVSAFDPFEDVLQIRWN